MIIMALYGIMGVLAVGATATGIGIVIKESLSDD